MTELSAQLAPESLTATTAPVAQGAVPSQHIADNQRSFAAALGRAGACGPQQSPPDRARDAAEQFVTQTLILPLLKQLRSANHASPPFAPTQAERQFGALQDAELAQRIAHATRFPLVDRLARDLLTKAGAGNSALTPDLILPAAGWSILSTTATSPGITRSVPGAASRDSFR